MESWVDIHVESDKSVERDETFCIAHVSNLCVWICFGCFSEVRKYNVISAFLVVRLVVVVYVTGAIIES